VALFYYVGRDPHGINGGDMTGQTKLEVINELERIAGLLENVEGNMESAGVAGDLIKEVADAAETSDWLQRA
jgi:hypothetical protein